jgi:hypothetical protein
VPEGGDVGPVLLKGAQTEAVLAALERRNPGVRFSDRGSYVRVLASGRCALRRLDVEEELGAPFRLPADLEPLMPSFAGRFEVSSDEASWVDLPR